MSKIQAYLEECGRRYRRISEITAYGDRRTYVDEIDIAGCPRNAVLSKTQPVKDGLEAMLKSFRYEAACHIYSNIFMSGDTLFDENIEICHPTNHRIKAHIRYLFKTEKTWHAVDLVPVDSFPLKALDSWNDKMQYQLNLLRYQPNADKFQIGGSVLAVNLNKGRFKVYNNYTPDGEAFIPLLNRALHMLGALNGTEEPICKVSTACRECVFKGDCPAQAAPEAEIPDDLIQTALAYNQLREQSRILGGLVQDLGAEITEFTGPKFAGSRNGVTIVTTKNPGRMTDLRVIINNETIEIQRAA